MSQARKYFGTDGIRGQVGQHPITSEFALQLGWAIGQVLAHDSARPKVLIGQDTRISGNQLATALGTGLMATGTEVHGLGCPLPTPAIAYLTHTLGAQAGVVISASHNPYHDNGIKLFSAAGTKLADDIEQAIETQLQSTMALNNSSFTKVTQLHEAADHYIAFCKSTVPAHFSLRGLKIVLDCANGATYQVAPQIFSELGAEVIALGVHPNGYNINDHCGSNYPRITQQKVRLAQANLGILFDGDGDRVLMVDHTGALVDGDELLFILAKAGSTMGRLRGGVVGTVMSNWGLELALGNLGLGFRRASVGDRHVNQLLQETGWQLGGESSGHIICRDITTTGDGIIVALQVLATLDQHATSLHLFKSGFEKLPQALINVCTFRPPKLLLTYPQIQQAIKAAEEELSGLGRVLLRPSGTEPLVRVMVEGSDSARVNQIAKRLAATVSSLA